MLFLTFRMVRRYFVASPILLYQNFFCPVAQIDMSDSGIQEQLVSQEKQDN